jgi:SAM-dependent methyltransferase
VGRAVRLLDDAALERSAVVANCCMNRERQLTGVNSYAKELGFDPLAELAARHRPAGAGAPPPGWLDLCCGSGRALIQAAERVRRGPAGPLAPADVALVGVDLVDAFDPVPAPSPGLELVQASVVTWAPTRSFDLITCLHGLHYVGDKLAVLARAAGWLTPTGRLVADLDLVDVRLDDGRPAGRRLADGLRAAGFRYDPRRRRIGCDGWRDVRLPYRYLGADDGAGPNYTGQGAVRSHYAVID